MTIEKIKSFLPYQDPFLFVDELLSVDENGIRGTYTYSETADFYRGHFKNNPVTPGVILTETMAQIGLVAYGIYLLNLTNTTKDLTRAQVALASTEMSFFIPVYPNEKVEVVSNKEYFRFNKLKCKVEMFNAKKELVCRGKIAGMLVPSALSC